MAKSLQVINEPLLQANTYRYQIAIGELCLFSLPHMDAFEIKEAVTKLAGEPFDAANFPFAFLEAFGNPEATITRLRAWVQK